MISLKAFIVPTSFLTLSAVSSILLPKSSEFLLFRISLPLILNFPPAKIAFSDLFSTLFSAFKLKSPAADIKSLFSIFFPVRFTVPPPNSPLLTIFPSLAFIVRASADKFLLLVKLLEVIVVTPVPVVSPLFDIFFPLIVRLCAPCNLPTKSISFVVIKLTLFPIISPVLSNFLLSFISIVLEATFLIFVILELLRSIFPLEAISPLFTRFVLFASISLSAVISFLFNIFCVLEKEILLNDNIFPSFVISLTFVEILSALILPLLVNLFPVTSRFVVSILLVFSRFPTTLNLSPEAIVPEFFKFFISIFSFAITFCLLIKLEVTKFLLVKILPLFVVSPLTVILSIALTSPMLFKVLLIFILLFVTTFPTFSSLDTVISLFTLNSFSFLISFEVKEPLVKIVPLFNTLFVAEIFSTA